MKRQIPLTSILCLAIFLLSLVTDWYAPLSICLLVVLLLSLLDNLGKAIVLREIVALHSVLTCAVMPCIGYSVYNKSDHLARIFFKYMWVPEDVYFSFALPALTGFVIVLCWPLKKAYSDEGDALKSIIQRAKEILRHKPMLGISLLAMGTVMFGVSPYLPESVRFIFVLLFFSAFAGFLYVFYQEGLRFRTLILFFFAAFIMAMALRSGMFTVVAYMGATLFSFLFLGRKVSLGKKVIWFVVGFALLFVIQSVKPTYRILTQAKEYKGNKGALFLSLIGEKLTKFDFASSDAFFPMYIRANQGWNISLVMKRFPDKMPFDEGKNIALNIASSFVPRFLWPDKPEAGGKYNMKYYAGLTIVGWSTNVGPLGEAYGSFGNQLGVIYMILLAGFIRLFYVRVFKLAAKIPLLICWLPVLFYQVTYAAETDSLQIFNSLLKSAFFIWLLYRFMPQLFGKEKKGRLPRAEQNVTQTLTYES